MKWTHLAIQSAVVVAMTASISWPQFRPGRPQPVWRYVPAVWQQGQTNELERADRDPGRRAVVGFGRASFQTTRPIAQSVPGIAEGLAPRYDTPIHVAALGGKVNALVGVAQTSVHMPIPYARVLLRNLSTGKVEARATANDEGRFSFLDVDASSYIIELLGPAGSVIAASEIVAIGRGDVRQTTIRTIAAAPVVAAAFGNTLTGTLAQTTSVAASDGITRTTSTLTPEASPNNPTGGGR